ERRSSNEGFGGWSSASARMAPGMRTSTRAPGSRATTTSTTTSTGSAFRSRRLAGGRTGESMPPAGAELVSSAVPVEDAASSSGTRPKPPPPPGLPALAEVMGQVGDENFPVASRLLGRRVRASLSAIYGFARFVDDVGDESGGDRLALLDWIDGEVDRVCAGIEPGHPVTARLAAAARESTIPAEPLHRLVEANRRDQLVHSYETFED